MPPNLTHPAAVANLLKTHKLFTQKQYGQHFLINQSVLDGIIQAADLNQSDIVLEVGTGIGVLTQRLAQTAKQVIAFEIDPQLQPVLEKTLGGYSNITLYFQDILTANLQEKLPNSYKLIANLPYNAGSHILDTLLKSSNPPQSITVLLQKEVAQKITAQPPHATYLSNFFHLYGRAALIQTVKPSSFFPPPKVDSAVLHVGGWLDGDKTTLPADNPNQAALMPPPNINPAVFSRFLHRGFANPRKMINKSFPAEQLLAAGINPSLRPENLAFEDWRRLFEIVQ